jgi:two-component system, OmpR family, response regulator CpxR
MRPRKRILYVSASETDMRVMRYMLEIKGYRVIGATTGQQAIIAVSEASFDLVLINFDMPNMNGIELVGRLKQIAPHIPMVILGDCKKVSGEMHRADAFLDKKSITSAELLERIGAMIQRKRRPSKGYKSSDVDCLSEVV